MLLIIRIEYDNSIIVIKIVSMLFFIKLRNRSKAPIQNLPIFLRLFPMEEIVTKQNICLNDYPVLKLFMYSNYLFSNINLIYSLSLKIE